ncbi:MAG: heparinase II/III family protein, partial [Pseudomonadota bacterium]
PMLAFFRHGDGAFASLGGATPLAPLALQALDAREEAGGTAVRNAIYSGYQRLEAASAVLIADAGEMASPAVSPGAHASALAFEFSDGPQRLVVNCGVPDGAPLEWRDAARTTAAHSTLTLNDVPSALLFEGGALAARYTKAQVIGVEASRGHTASGERLDMRHSGYARRFGLVHARTLALLSDGSALQGCDMLEADEETDTDLKTQFTLRFHLHPKVTVGRSDRALRLLLPDGTAWSFLADRTARIEESACVTPERGLRPTRQIVLSGDAAPGVRVRWKFARA